MLLKVSRQNDACIMLVKRAIGHHWSIIGASLHHHPSIIRAVSWHEASLCHTPTLLSNSTSFIRSIYMCGPPIFEEVFLFLSCHVWVVWLTYPQGRHLSNVSFKRLFQTSPSLISFTYHLCLSPSLIICLCPWLVICLLSSVSFCVLSLWYVCRVVDLSCLCRDSGRPVEEVLLSLSMHTRSSSIAEVHLKIMMCRHNAPVHNDMSTKCCSNDNVFNKKLLE